MAEFDKATFDEYMEQKVRDLFAKMMEESKASGHESASHAKGKAHLELEPVEVETPRALSETEVLRKEVEALRAELRE